MRYSACAKRVLLFTAGLTLLATVVTGEVKQPWRAPRQSGELRNPMGVTPRGLKSSALLYEQNCALCHGKTGASNGRAAKALPQKPADFTDEEMMRRVSDGELFWKITTGRAPMPSWRESLSESKRWEMVNYLRMLAMRAQYRYLGTAD
jgi:hypothetical protein